MVVEKKSYLEVLHFWFEEIEVQQYFVKDIAFDEELRTRFGKLHQHISMGEGWQWRTTPEGRLAECIVLDQFSRNLFRDTPRAFAYDPMALALAQEAVASGADQEITEIRQRVFFYMPYMHSESVVIHQEAIQLFSQPGLEQSLIYEHKHKEIIDKFGHYPHRNKILRRPTSAEEEIFLQKKDSSFSN